MLLDVAINLIPYKYFKSLEERLIMLCGQSEMDNNRRLN